LDIRGLLCLDIHADGVSFGGHDLQQVGSGCSQLFGALFHDGLRQIQLSNGLSIIEWDRFIDLVTVGREAKNVVPGGVGTALWKAELPHLEFTFRRRNRLLIDDDPDDVENELRRIARVVTGLVAEQSSGHERLAAGDEEGLQTGLAAAAEEDPNTTLQAFAILIVELVEEDLEGQDTEILQRATMNLVRESFLAGELRPVIALHRALMAPAEEGKRSQAIRRGRLATLLSGSCCDPNLVRNFAGKGQQLEVLTQLVEQLGFDAVAPYLELLRQRPEAPLARAVATGLGERLNSAAADLRSFTNADECQEILGEFLGALVQMVPSPQVVSVLEPLRQHRDAEVTEAVAELLSRAIAVSSVDDARRLLDSQDSTERRAALLYFSSQRDEKAAQVLVSFLSAGTKANWNRLGLRRAYTCLGKMRSHHGHAYLEKLLSAKGLTGRLKSSPDEQILAVRGLVSANDAFAKKLLDMVMNEKQFSGPVRLALTRMRDSKR
ncbi:MAG: hypothetical protein OSB21_14110, partial [Myxococcota bacterium]|nr:hypothetical protein [Myxococcota bacterium]